MVTGRGRRTQISDLPASHVAYLHLKTIFLKKIPKRPRFLLLKEKGGWGKRNLGQATKEVEEKKLLVSSPSSCERGKISSNYTHPFFPAPSPFPLPPPSPTPETIFRLARTRDKKMEEKEESVSE